MYVNLKDASGICFSTCEHCRTSCCDGGRFILAPLVLDDFTSVYENFLIAFAKIDEKLRVVMLISNRDKPCVYYKDNLCTIYDSRPPACVMYPFTPFYDEVLIDTACDAVGYVGFELKVTEEVGIKQVHSSFYHKRLEGFSKKLERTEDFLNALDKNFKVILTVEGVELMSYEGSREDDVLKMHKSSLKHLSQWL